MLEFSRTINLDLSNYDEDGACKYWAGVVSPAPRTFAPQPLRSLIAVLFPPSLLSLSRASFVGRVCGVV